MLKRLLAGALFGAGATLLAAAEAGDRLDLKYMYYWDRNRVWNHTPTFAFLKQLPNHLSFKWNQEVDVVSGASRRLGLRNIGRTGENEKKLDGISGASRREVRHSEQATLAYANQGRTASASFYYSDENDYTSYSPAASAGWDFNDRNTTVSAAWSLFFDAFRPQAGFEGLGGDRRIQSFSLGLTQVVTPLSLVSVGIHPIRSSGYLGHPYNPVITDSGAMLQERLPDSKWSAALTGKWIQGWRLGERLGSLHAEARWYRDDWRLSSGTLDLQGYQYLREGTWVRLRARYYRQGAAAFWKDTYAGNEAYRTADIRFSGFSSLTLGLKIASAFPESWAESALLPDRWDLGYDHAVRDTRGEMPRGGSLRPFLHYQLYDPDQYYLQGTLMAGLAFDL